MPHLAIARGTPVRTEAYPQWPVWDQHEIDAVTAVIRSGQWGGFPEPGPHAASFAAAFGAFQGARHGICMANGTVTMIVALRAAGIQLGDEVIVPAYTFAATAYAPLDAGVALHSAVMRVVADMDQQFADIHEVFSPAWHSSSQSVQQHDWEGRIRSVQAGHQLVHLG